MFLLFVGFVVVTLTATGIYAFEKEQEHISGNVVIHDVALATQAKTNHWRILRTALSKDQVFPYFRRFLDKFWQNGVLLENL